MEFKFVISTTWEVKDKDILYDLIEIQKYINNRLVGKTFGVSVDKFLFGYEIADSEGELPHRSETANLRRYGKKYLLIVKQFDYRQLINRSGKEQFNYLKVKILESIDDVEKLNKKPKLFDKEEFRNTLNEILSDYGQKKWMN
jgi:hypothetical protein